MLDKVSRNNLDHYIWGNNCNGWRLLNNPEISIIQEKMPPGTSEKMHFHKVARQFFFILEGTGSMETNEQTFVLEKNEGIEIIPGTKHRFFNSSGNPVEFLVTSVPSTLNDRFDST